MREPSRFSIPTFRRIKPCTLNNELSEMVRINVRNGFERSSRCEIWTDGRVLGMVDFHERSSGVMV